MQAHQVVDRVFEDIAAAGELQPSALLRLLALYKQTTLEAALAIVVTPSPLPCILLPSRSFTRAVLTKANANAGLIANHTRTSPWCRKWWRQVAGHFISWRALAMSLTVLAPVPLPFRAFCSCLSIIDLFPRSLCLSCFYFRMSTCTHTQTSLTKTRDEQCASSTTAPARTSP